MHAVRMHRMHTARLLGFPCYRAVVDQFTLPTKVDWSSLLDYGEIAAADSRN